MRWGSLVAGIVDCAVDIVAAADVVVGASAGFAAVVVVAAAVVSTVVAEIAELVSVAVD